MDEFNPSDTEQIKSSLQEIYTELSLIRKAVEGIVTFITTMLVITALVVVVLR